jgi:hypothetical protein
MYEHGDYCLYERLIFHRQIRGFERDQVMVYKERPECYGIERKA